jgi:hypothetical protein
MKKCRILAMSLALILVMVGLALATSFILKVGERTVLGQALATDFSAGHLKVWSGSAPGVENAATGTLLIDWTLNATNNTSNGVITLGAVSNVNASATNTAGYFRITKADGTTAVAEGDVGTSAASLILNTLSIVINGPCSLSGTLTVPAGT